MAYVLFVFLIWVTLLASDQCLLACTHCTHTPQPTTGSTMQQTNNLCQDSLPSKVFIFGVRTNTHSHIHILVFTHTKGDLSHPSILFPASLSLLHLPKAGTLYLKERQRKQHRKRSKLEMPLPLCPSRLLTSPSPPHAHGSIFFFCCYAHLTSPLTTTLHNITTSNQLLFVFVDLGERCVQGYTHTHIHTPTYTHTQTHTHKHKHKMFTMSALPCRH